MSVSYLCDYNSVECLAGRNRPIEDEGQFEQITFYTESNSHAHSPVTTKRKDGFQSNTGTMWPKAYSTS